MATRFDRRLEKLQDKHGEPEMLVWVNYDDEATEAERTRYLAATRGRGSFVVISKEMANL